MIDKDNLPKHIAIIMDGNGRWARMRHLPKIAGHRQGVESVREVLKYCRRIGIPILTIYAFSRENWKRPKKEVNLLMGLIEEYIDKELNSLKKNEIRLNCIGRLDGLPSPIEAKIKKAMEETRDYTRLIFNIALNYGARSEIVDAVNTLLSKRLRRIDEKTFSRFLYTKDLPDPDLLIRTSGEMRVSNFLLWQISYTEFYFTEKLWPDFKSADLEDAIKEYQKRGRRYGGRE